jgi:hypothetical protein
MKRITILAFALAASTAANAQQLSSATFSYSFQDDQGGPVTSYNLTPSQLASSSTNTLTQNVPGLVINQTTSSADVYGGLTWSLDFNAGSGPKFNEVTLTLSGTYSQPYGYYNSNFFTNNSVTFYQGNTTVTGFDGGTQTILSAGDPEVDLADTAPANHPHAVVVKPWSMTETFYFTPQSAGQVEYDYLFVVPAGASLSLDSATASAVTTPAPASAIVFGLSTLAAGLRKRAKKA